MSTNKTTIQRLTPPRSSNKKRASIKEILDAANKVKEAVEVERKKYGGLGFT